MKAEYKGRHAQSGLNGSHDDQDGRAFLAGGDDQRKLLIGAGEILQRHGCRDEVLERAGPERLKQAARTAGRTAVYSLRIAYLWDDAQHVRVDGIWGRFARPSFFRLKGQPLKRLHFPQTVHGGNFHCGNVPRGLVGDTRKLDVRLKHLGYVTRDQRQSKYTWYTRIDPNSQAEDHYRHLAELPDASYAPGPAQITPWSE